MTEYLIKDTTLNGIANAIREKDGSSASIPASDFASRIGAIKTGIDFSELILTLENGSTYNFSTITGLSIPQGSVIKITDATGTKLFPPALMDCTPSQIQAIARSGQAANYWAIGDTVGITINGTVSEQSISNETYYVFIIGFNHNSGIEGNNTIHFQFAKTQEGRDIALSHNHYNNGSGFIMTKTNDDVCGWSSCYMRTTVCQEFFNAMPTEWQNVIASCTKYTDNVGDGNDTASYVTATSDKIWLLAEFEVFGKRTNANNAEKNYQKQYDYYVAGNSKIKYRHNSMSYATMWWLRSVRSTQSTVWSCVNTSGTVGRDTEPRRSRGFAPGFMVA